MQKIVRKKYPRIRIIAVTLLHKQKQNDMTHTAKGQSINEQFNAKGFEAVSTGGGLEAYLNIFTQRGEKLELMITGGDGDIPTSMQKVCTVCLSVEGDFYGQDESFTPEEFFKLREITFKGDTANGQKGTKTITLY